MEKINVFIADWQVLFREGIHFTLSGEENIGVVGEAADNDEALAFIEANSPDVAVLNIDQGKVSGIEVARHIRHNMLGVSVVLIMDSEDEEQLFSAIKSGASACLTKDTDPDDLVDTVGKVAQGICPLSGALLRPGIASRVIDEFEVLAVIGERLNNLLARLTPREAEVLHQIADGSSSEQVSQALGMSEQAVRQQLELIRTKLVANDQNREVIEAAQSDLLSMIPGDGLTGKPAVEYVTKDEFTEFKESLRERFKAFAGELG